MTRFRTITAALAAAALASVTAVALAPAASAEVSGGVTIPAFYDPPTRLPSADGAIIRSRPTTLAVSLQLPGMSGPLPARATLLMYKSTDSTGHAVAVTGTYLEPTVPWAAGGARPLVSVAEGTQGQGDQCSPSYGLTHPVTITPSTVQVSYEIPSIYALLSRGVAVVVTDYVGLGTTDRLHTYVNRVDEGRAVLDAARAARNLPGTSLTAASKVATYGYSQGGGASAAAAELQRSYAPELPLVGSYAGAPPADLSVVLKGIDGTALVGAIGWAVNGFAQAYPRLRPVLAANVSAAGRAVLTDLQQACTPDAILRYAFHSTSEWTTSGQSLSQVIAANPVAKAVVDAQRIGRIAPAVPVRVSTGTLDDFVSHAQGKQLAADWCSRGADVTYAPIRQYVPTFGTGVNHLAPALSDAPAAQQWVVDRLLGRPITSNCAAVPSLP
ncbi:lipase family protein [Jatrophihabitans sp. YIM 134969]